MSKFNKIPNRSDHYQNILLEIAYPHELLDIFPDSDSIYKKLNPFSYNDEIAELHDLLNKELWRIIEDHLTDRQKQVVKLYASGKTQIEIAKILGVNQSSITKCLSGDTLIYTSAGNAKLGDLWLGWEWNPYTIMNYQVACMDRKLNIKYNTINNVICQGEKPILEITTISGKTIKATPDHKFYTAQGWVELQTIIENNLQLAILNDIPTKLDDIGPEIGWENIIKYENKSNEVVFDLSMKAPNHNFIANGIITHNCINGNVDYKNKDSKGKPITYGGVKLKLQKIAKEDKVINEILQKIADIRDNDPF